MNEKLEIEIKNNDIVKTLIETTEAMIMIIDEDTKIIHVNKKFEKIAGYLKREIENKMSWTDFVPEKQVKKLLNYHKLRRTGQGKAPKRYISSLINKRGEEKNIIINVNIVKDTKISIASIKDITQQIKLEKRLAEVSENYKNLIENQTDLIVKVNNDQEFLFVSQSYCELFGKTKEELMGKKYMPLVHEEDRKATEEAVGSLYKPPYTCYIEQRAWTKDGWRWIAWKDKAILNKEKEVLGIVGIGRDITEKKITEEALKKNEKRLSNILNLIPEIIIETDSNLNIKYINPQGFKVTGYSKCSLGENLINFLVPEDRKIASENIKNLIEGGKIKNSEYGLLKKDGSKITMLANSVKLTEENGDFKGLLVSTMDITNLKEIRNNLIISEKHYKSLFDNSIDGILRTTIDGKVIAANHAIIKMLGYASLEEFLSLNVPKDIYANGKTRPGPKQRNKIFENVLKRKDGANIDVETSSRVIYKEGKPVYYEGIVRNITDRKKSFERLEEAFMDFISTLTAVIESKDPYTSGHQKRVSEIATVIAREMGLNKNKVQSVKIASMVHDIGKISIPHSILSKPGKISRVELEIIKTHSQVGHNILKDIKFPWPLAKIILQHHERIDGSGYPKGIKGKDMLIEAKILAVADVVEAMTSHRPYRPALGIKKAIEELSKNKGKLYDSEVVEACVKLYKENKLKFETIEIS